MSRAASTVPEESALLCEGCGYILSGLPADSRCPECAKPIDQSSPRLRTLPAWEVEDGTPRWRRFWRTTFGVLFRPTQFFRSLATRVEASQSSRFARRHYRLASLLFSLAACVHLHWLYEMPPLSLSRTSRLEIAIVWAIVLYPLCYLFLTMVIALAARLTAWEAAYRGHRLPLRAVRRGLDYHAAHYLPVALLALLTVAGYQLLLHAGLLTGLSATRYIYLLCAEVVLAAGYLFVTYWKGMRNMLFANG